LTFNGIHGVVAEEKEVFITIAVRISDPTCRTIIVEEHSEGRINKITQKWNVAYESKIGCVHNQNLSQIVFGMRNRGK
jgi:hypothetical protein